MRELLQKQKDFPLSEIQKEKLSDLTFLLESLNDFTGGNEGFHVFKGVRESIMTGTKSNYGFSLYSLDEIKEKIILNKKTVMLLEDGYFYLKQETEFEVFSLTYYFVDAGNLNKKRNFLTDDDFMRFIDETYYQDNVVKKSYSNNFIAFLADKFKKMKERVEND